MSTKSCLCSGSSSLALGLARLDLITFVPDSVQLDPMSSLRSTVQVGLLMLVLDLLHLGFTLLIQGPACSGSALLAFQKSRPDLLSPILDLTLLGFLMSLKSPGYLDLATSALCRGRLGLIMFVLDSVHPGSVLSVQSII